MSSAFSEGGADGANHYQLQPPELMREHPGQPCKTGESMKINSSGLR